jgi:hypothetical protein
LAVCRRDKIRKSYELGRVLYTGVFGTPLPAPDGFVSIQKSLEHERVARMANVRTVAILSDFVLHGIEPKDHA